MRKWRVDSFDNHLVFYEPSSNGVVIVRVLHSASNWPGILMSAR
jgi:plasmid stabilization system protein ParE